jgi:Barrel-sandwich domain of CusB or HlyD membrane-fusion
MRIMCRSATRKSSGPLPPPVPLPALISAPISVSRAVTTPSNGAVRQVPQELSAGIKAGLSAELHLPQYPDKTFKAMVTTTSSAINTNARTLLVELHADNPKSELQPGAYAQVDFQLPADSNVVRIPTSALVFRQHGMEVATIGPDQKIALKPIELGRNLGVEVEVLKGLTTSDRLVNSPPDSLATGDSVRVTGESPRATGGAQTRDATARETMSSRTDSKVRRGEQISEPTD